MATPIRMPDLGTTVETIILRAWLKEEGESVCLGEPLCEVETDKAVSELESAAEGVLLRQVVSEGTEVQSGAIIAYVGAPGEQIPDDKIVEPRGAEERTEPDALPKERAAPTVSPLIRHLAEREGVDLNAVVGTGIGGRITRDDVLKAKSGDEPDDTAAKELPTHQRAVARRVLASHHQIVPFDMVCRIDMSSAEALRERLEGQLGRSVSYDAVFIHAVSRIVADFPDFLKSLTDDSLVVRNEITIGFIVGLSEGLYAPAVARADQKSPEQIEKEVKRLAVQAARGKLPVDASTGACLTISNLSMHPIQSFNAVIPPGQSAALAIGGVEETPLWRDGQVTAAPMASVTLTVDHRIINGQEAARFLARLKEFMEAL